jgi:hypothetical protein
MQNRAPLKHFSTYYSISINQTKIDREVIAMNKTKDFSKTISKNNPVTEQDTKIIDIAKPAGQTQLIDYTDSIANIFKFEPEGSKTRGFPVKAKQPDIYNMDSKTNTKSLPLLSKTNLSDINMANQNNQNSAIGDGQFSILVDGFIFDKSATAALRRISTETKLPIIISIKNGFYNLMIEGFTSRKDAKLFDEKLTQMGFKGSIIKKSI